MANKLAEHAVAGVETFGGLVQKTVGKAIGSERLQEMGQGLLDRADALRNRGADPADEPTVDEPASDAAPSRTALEADATAQVSQTGHPPSLHPKAAPRRQHQL